jgi:hypothetical protein
MPQVAFGEWVAATMCYVAIGGAYRAWRAAIPKSFTSLAAALSRSR